MSAVNAFTVKLISGTPEDAAPVRAEALRYMGYRGASPDAETLRLIAECERELAAAVKPVCCFAHAPLEITERGVDLGFGTIESRNLAKHLEGCTSAILFAATIGIGADRLIAKYGRLKPAKSVVIDALGSSAAESWCDAAEKRVTGGSPHCSRFSPGYGDFALSHQIDFMRCLDMNRRLGITLSDSLLMTPTKSVTAVIGIGAENKTCSGKCAFCGSKTCAFREDGK